MESVNSVEKYYKLFIEEKNFNYKYNPIKNNHKRISVLFNNNIKIRKLKILHQKEKEKNQKEKNNIKNNNLVDNIKAKRESILEEKFLLSQIKKKKEIIEGNKNRIKGYFTKLQCPYCKSEISSKEKYISKTNINNRQQHQKTETETDIFHNFYNYKNKNFHDITSYFIYSVNNFPLINIKTPFKFNLEKEEKLKLYKTTYSSNSNKKTDMESELSKNNKIKKYKEIKRENINVNNLYKIEKPLLTSIRGKIYKNMRQRFKKPLRLIILKNGYNHPMFKYHSYN